MPKPSKACGEKNAYIHVQSDIDYTFTFLSKKSQNKSPFSLMGNSS